MKNNQEFNNLNEAAQLVWNTSDLGAKKTSMIQMVKSFKFKQTAEQHITAINTMTSQKIDKLAADLMLVGHHEKVIRQLLTISLKEV